MLVVPVLYVRADSYISYSFADDSYVEECDTNVMHMMWDKLKVIKDFEIVLNDSFNEAHHLDLNGDGIVDSLRIIAIQKEYPLELLLQACVAKNIWADVATMYIAENSSNTGGGANLYSENDGYADLSMNLSLEAILVSLFETSSLYAFEEKLNSSLHLSNMDCNNDGMVDNLFVEEFIDGGLHMICINAMLSAIEYQEIACIYALKLPQNNRIELEIMGNPYIFGYNCIVHPRWYNNPPIFKEIFSSRIPYTSHRDGFSFGNTERWSTNHYQDKMRTYISVHSYLISDFSYPIVLSGFFSAQQRSHYDAYENHSPNRAYHERNNTEASKNAYSEKQETEASTSPVRRDKTVQASESHDRTGSSSTTEEKTGPSQGLPTVKHTPDTVMTPKTTSPSVRYETTPTPKTQPVSPPTYTKEPFPRTKAPETVRPTQQESPKTTSRPQTQKPQTPQPPVQQPAPNKNKPTTNNPQPAKPQPTGKTEQKPQKQESTTPPSKSPAPSTKKMK